MVYLGFKQHVNSRVAPQSASANNHIACRGAESGRDTGSKYPSMLAGDKTFARLDIITQPAWLDE